MGLVVKFVIGAMALVFVAGSANALSIQIVVLDAQPIYCPLDDIN